MGRFSLEVESWMDYEVDSSYSTLSEAKQYATTQYPQNSWRVIDMNSGDICHSSSNLEDVISIQARDELDRFDRSDRFVQRMADAREREARRLRENRRMERLHGANTPNLTSPESFGKYDPVGGRVNWKREGF